MRKEVQFKVKRDLKDCTPAPADTSVSSKDEIPDISKLTNSNSSDVPISNAGCSDNLKFAVKQEIDDVDEWRETQHNLDIPEPSTNVGERLGSADTNITKVQLTSPQLRTNYANHYLTNENVDLCSGNQVRVSEEILPVNLSIVKRCNSGDEYSADQLKIGKRKRYPYTISEDESKTGNMFCSVVYNPEFCRKSSYTQTQVEGNAWEQTSSGTYVAAHLNDSNSHISYRSSLGETGNAFSPSVQNRDFIAYDSSLREKQPAIADMSLDEKAIRCSCDKCLPPSCDKCDSMPKYLNNTGEELFRRIEESLAETETLKCQEEELFKRIAKSLNEAETLKFKEEELLKKIERSLTEAESLKSREEEILRRIEVSLAKSETVRPQDDELLIKIEASLQNRYSVTDEEIEFGSKYNIDLDFSLPLKKRKKRLKTLIQKDDVKQNLSMESFPSYPSRPMISIAELLQKSVPVFEHSSPVPHYSSKSLYYNNMNAENEYLGMLDCTSKNEMDSKIFNFCKREGTLASCSYSTSPASDFVCKDKIKREIISPSLTEQNFSSGVDTNVDTDYNKEVVCKMEMGVVAIKEEENTKVNLKCDDESRNEEKKCSFHGEDAHNIENCSNSDKDASEMKQEITLIDCELIKKENTSD